MPYYGTDPELKAMDETLKAVRDLSMFERQRVFAWVSARCDYVAAQAAIETTMIEPAPALAEVF